MTDTEQMVESAAAPAWEPTAPTPLDSAGRPVDEDGIPLYGPARAEALAERDAQNARAAAAAERLRKKLESQGGTVTGDKSKIKGDA